MTPASRRHRPRAARAAAAAAGPHLARAARARAAPRRVRRHRRAEPARLRRSRGRLRARRTSSRAGSTASTPPTARARTATCRASAICALLTRIGYSPIMQISCRDYNRIAIQGNVLGRRGARRLQHPVPDRRRRAVRRPSRGQAGLRPRLDLAAADDPHDARRAAVPVRPQDHLARRRCSWARPRTPSRRPTISGRSASPRRSRPAPSSARRSTASTCRCWSTSWTQVRDMGLDEHCFILVGVGPLASARTARWMRANVAGRPHSRRGHRAAGRRRRTRRPRASGSASS